ncbi:MAG TPA: tail fiber protein [Prolixibacteraceae bacterium]|nr:tail fiber protein [Prolixibacteraceae bacterium]HPS13517.1 tail fiber protein [Prolixibacteraceae bacterium]
METILGEIRLFPIDYAPAGWLECNGQTLQVAQYTGLYSLIGSKFGGSAMTFCLPNMSSIAPLGGKAKYYIATEGEFPERV